MRLRIIVIEATRFIDCLSLHLLHAIFCKIVKTEFTTFVLGRFLFGISVKTHKYGVLWWTIVEQIRN